MTSAQARAVASLICAIVDYHKISNEVSQRRTLGNISEDKREGKEAITQALREIDAQGVPEF